MKDDVELVAAALAGGPKAFGPIVERYKDAVFGIALSRLRSFHDAEDVAQGVFLQAFERLEDLRDPARLGAWLRSITIHRAIDHLRRRRDGVDIERADDEAGSVSVWRREEERRGLRDQVMAAIGRLSKTQRETTTLFYINGYSVEEVAAIQEVPAGTVKCRLHDAREKLKEEMIGVVEEVLKAEAPKEGFGQRVFDLLCRYEKPAPSWPWEEIEAELRKIGMDGVEGFRRAMQLPHGPTRRFALRFSGVMDGVARPSEGDRQEIVVEVLKEALRDRNKKVRAWAAPALLDLDVDEKRKRDEFIPLVVPLLRDKTGYVRWRVAYELQAWAQHVPLEVAARALADESASSNAWRQLAGLVRAVLDDREKEETKQAAVKGDRTWRRPDVL